MRVISVRVTDEEHEEMKRLARESGTTMTALGALAIKEKYGTQAQDLKLAELVKTKADALAVAANADKEIELLRSKQDRAREARSKTRSKPRLPRMQRRMQIAEILTKRSNRPIGFDDLCAEIERRWKAPVDRTTVSSALTGMRKAGLLERLGRGRTYFYQLSAEHSAPNHATVN